MKVFTLTQTTKQHNVNRLHDAFVLAGLIPVTVESTATESTFKFDDAVEDSAIQTVITNYVYTAPSVPPDIKAMGVAYRAKVNAISNLADAKALLNGELWQILKYLALRDVDIT